MTKQSRMEKDTEKAYEVGIKLTPNPHSITFHDKDGNTIGEFNFDKLPCTFKGDVDASAKMFVDAVSNYLISFVEEARSEGYEKKITKATRGVRRNGRPQSKHQD